MGTASRNISIIHLLRHYAMINLTILLQTVAKNAVEKAEPVGAALAPSTDDSTYFLARILMKFCYWIMDFLGQSHNSTLFLWLYTIVVFLFSMAIGIFVKWLVVAILHRLEHHVKSAIYDRLVNRKFFTRTCRILPALMFLILIQFTLYMHSSLASWLTRLSFVYIIVVVAVALCTLCDVIWDTLNEHENKRHLPLHGIVQVIKLLIWIISVIIIAAILLGKSPGTLLAGLGAFAAVLMLIFKDSILGIVAGVQLAQNDSLHVGDWIAIPGGEANGTVDEVSLTAVKIINWDKTVSTVPPYTLITGGFKNYRNMQISGTRRIQRSYMIDADSVEPVTDAMLQKFMKIPLIAEWIKQKMAQRAAGKTEDVNNSAGLVDGSLETNLGIFRAYMKIYLDLNPDISHNDTCFVTTLAQTATGVPLQIYCFTSTSSWLPYESIQAGVFEHIAAMLSEFDLYGFENPTGRDTIIDGYMSPGKSPANVFGIPYPFFTDSGTPEAPGVPPQPAEPKA